MVWFGPDLELKRDWSEEQAKVDAQVGTWISRRLSLKGRAEACAVYAFFLILYRLAVFPLPKALRLVLQRSLSKSLGKPKADDPYTCLHPTYAQRESGYV